MEWIARELLAAAQQEGKAKLDAGRIDTVFKVGDRVIMRLLTNFEGAARPRPRTSASSGRSGTDRSRSRPVQAPTPTTRHGSTSRDGCCAARQSTSTGSRHSTSGSTR
jgi:hypothetical protein